MPTEGPLATVRFRAGRPADAAGVVTVARDCWHAAYDDILGEDTVTATVDNWYDRDEVASATRDDDHVLEVAVTDRVVAFAHAGPHPEADGALLYGLYADPDWWGTRIGRRLVDRVLPRLDGHARVRAVVIADNDVGVDFYESYGWERVATREADVGEQSVEEYVYELPLRRATISGGRVCHLA